MKPEDSLILLVDDTKANLKLLSHVLSKEGYKYIEANNGQEAIELAEEHEPDLILLDIMMPDIDGFEVIKRLKKKDKLADVPIIFLSSLTETDDKVQGFKSGGVDYITKPFQREETLARIRTHLQIRSLQMELNERIKILRDREIQLSRLNKKKDDLVRMVSHDIKNPLTGIIGLVKLIRDSDKISDEEQTQMLSVIEDSGNNLLNLVRDVLDRESKKMESDEVEIASTDLSELMERVISMNKAKAVVKSISLSYAVNPEKLSARVDPNKMEIAINNLVSNALKFTPSDEGAKVHANIKQVNNDVLISVSDTGIGIPEKMQEDLFTDNKNASRVGTSGELGTGLGLDIVQLYVEMHGGEIWVESEIKKGTTFYIKLPEVI